MKFLIENLDETLYPAGYVGTKRTVFHMAEYKHGEMDTTEQEKTFDAFIKWSTRVAIFSICVLIFMALVNG